MVARTLWKSDQEARARKTAVRFSIEKAIEYIAGDEFVEATPKSIRLRKRILNQTDRRKAGRADRKGETAAKTDS